MSMRAKNASELSDEARIVWLKDISKIPYVREHFEEYCNRRKGKLKYNGNEIVGYAELTDNAPSNNRFFSRRLFWLSIHDRVNEPEGAYKTGCPREAVDPTTIFPGVMGRITERAWGEELPPNFRQN